MAALSKLKRVARLCGWVALSSGAMMASACGSMLAACSSSSRSDDGGRPDAGASSDAAHFVLPDAAPAQTNPVDADQADLWNVICE